MSLDQKVIEQEGNNKKINFSSNPKEPLHVLLTLAKNEPVKASIHDSHSSFPVYDSWFLTSPDIQRLIPCHEDQQKTQKEFYNQLNQQLEGEKENGMVKNILRKLDVSLSSHVKGTLYSTEKTQNILIETTGVLAELSALSSVQLLRRRYRVDDLGKAETLFNASQLYQGIHESFYTMNQEARKRVLPVEGAQSEQVLPERLRRLISTRQELGYPQSTIVGRSFSHATTYQN